MGWRVFAASAIGSAHVEAGLPCQDAFAHEVVGEVLCAAVCDGAGSAAASDQGARLLASRVVQELAGRTRERGYPCGLGADELREGLVAIIARVRSELQLRAESDGRALSDYAATLVGVVAARRGGWMFHVGDGVAVARPVDGDRPETVSLPENGEYANETYFVTGEEWQAHLRLLPIAGSAELIALLSDGAAPFAMQRGLSGIFRPFMDPVARHLREAAPDAGADALAGLLGDPRTHAITTDDKTLLIALWQE